ncbi:unnamed protein product [Paramecium sonneborni]|uniref:VWFA domain-containing protein n=1 Tax=Paramecium sonneborni TaxID=65129 RepID=A0A8S1LIB3_9CILI|nr:unnamed protein product [Paramecium sonneborni]
MFQEIQLNYFKVPSAKSEQTQLLAVLDCSGSMSSQWQYVAKYYNEIRKNVKQHCAITFDTKVKTIAQADLSYNINTYGGGGTDITIAFSELNKLLYSLKQKKNVTVLFVSDGQGSFTKDLINKSRPEIQNLNFICIGVGKGFPTFIAMDLREMYHNGDRSIPSLFLVNTTQGNQDKNFEIEMLTAAQYMKHQTPIKSNPCYQFPWDQMTDTIWPDSWVSFYTDELETEKGKLQKIEVTGEQIGQIAAYWLQNLQLLSLKKKVSQEAQKALEEINKFIKKKKLTFLERTQEQKSALYEIIQELKFLASSQTLQELDQEAAAQRLKIGTSIGKYHNRALKFAGVSVEAFQTYKDEFIEMIEKTKFVNYNFPASILSLQNQIDILTDPELIQGLKNCETQYHLVSSLPIIGYAIYVKRSDQSKINPYSVEVLNIARINKYIDSLAIIDSPNHEIEFNIGDNDKEKFNCLLPLYQHEIIAPFLRSNVFYIQMTFVLMENADTCFENAYAALLGNTLLYMICQEENQWKYEMIELINSSFILSYSQSVKAQFHLEKLLADPIGTMADENLETKTQCEDLSKTILMLNQIKNNFNQDQFKIIIQRLIIEAICRIVRYEKLFKKVMEIDIQKNEIINLIKDQFSQEELDNIQNFENLKLEIANKIKNLNVNFNNFVSKMEFNKPLFEQLLNGQKFKIKTLQSVFRYFLNEELPEDLFIIAAYHSRIEKSYERTKKEVEWNVDNILNNLLIEQQIKEIEAEIFQSVYNSLRNKCKYLQGNQNKNKQKMPKNSNGNQRMTRVERRRIRKQKLREQKLLQQQQPLQQQQIP